MLDTQPNTKLVSCYTVRFNKISESKWQLPKPSIKNFIRYNCFPISNLIRKKDFDAVGGFDESLPALEDWDLWLRMLTKDEDIYQIPEYLFYYRNHNDSEHIGLSKQYIVDNSKRKKLLQIIYKKHFDRMLEDYLNLIELAEKHVQLQQEHVQLQQQYQYLHHRVCLFNAKP